VKFAKKLSAAMPRKFSLKKYLHESMVGFDPPRSVKRIHASAVTKELEFCPRAHALIDITGNEDKSEFIGTSMQYTFGIGRALEKMLREDWAGAIAYGDWECHSCGTPHYMQFRPVACKYCHAGGKGFRYVEPRFTSAISGLSGGIDLMVRLPGYKKATLIEVKTMKEDEWKALSAPLSEHRLRTNLYLRLVDESDGDLKNYVMTDRAIIIYLVKGFGAKDPKLKDLGVKELFSPFKEFIIERDDSKTDHLTDKGVQWLTWKNTGTPPDRICDSPDCARASKCPVKKPCFSAPKSLWTDHYENNGH